MPRRPKPKPVEPETADELKQIDFLREKLSLMDKAPEDIVSEIEKYLKVERLTARQRLSIDYAWFRYFRDFETLKESQSVKSTILTKMEYLPLIAGIMRIESIVRKMQQTPETAEIISHITYVKKSLGDHAPLPDKGRPKNTLARFAANMVMELMEKADVLALKNKSLAIRIAYKCCKDGAVTESSIRQELARKRTSPRDNYSGRNAATEWENAFRRRKY